MSDPKFTKEEWEVANGLLVGDQVLFVHAYPKQVICRLTKQVDTTPLTDEDVANAHLIAAAPEMYALLDGLVEYLDEITLSYSYDMDERDKHISNINQLLTKARGEV